MKYRIVKHKGAWMVEVRLCFIWFPSVIFNCLYKAKRYIKEQQDADKGDIIFP